MLDAKVLKHLRHSRHLSQEELANECSVGRFRVSISSIKRAETGKPVSFRIARELARFFDVPANQIVCANTSSSVCNSACNSACNAVNDRTNDESLRAPRESQAGGAMPAGSELNRLKGLLLR
jgi:transcriptional regulator with XRE-family HTH domain